MALGQGLFRRGEGYLSIYFWTVSMWLKTGLTISNEHLVRACKRSAHETTPVHGSVRMCHQRYLVQRSNTWGHLLALDNWWSGHIRVFIVSTILFNAVFKIVFLSLHNSLSSSVYIFYTRDTWKESSKLCGTKELNFKRETFLINVENFSSSNYCEFLCEFWNIDYSNLFWVKILTFHSD